MSNSVIDRETRITQAEALEILAQEIRPKNGGLKRPGLRADLRIQAVKVLAFTKYINEGKSYAQVSQELGWASPRSAYDAVQAVMRDVVHGSVTEMRATTKERLDTLLPIYFEKAMHGDLKAAQFVKSLAEFEADVYGYKQQPAQNEQDIERQTREASQQRSWAEDQLAALCRQFSEANGRTMTPDDVLAELNAEHGPNGASLAQSLTEALGGDMTQSAAVN